MTATAEAKPWDFSHVLDLVNTLSTIPDPPSEQTQHEEQHSPAVEATSNGHNIIDSEPRGLGDFGKLWQYFGLPDQSPSFTSVSQSPVKVNGETTSNIYTSINYTSDGAFDAVSAAKNKLSSKQKQKQPAPSYQPSSAEDQTADTLSDGSTIPDTPTLTKTQRKKKNRKERRAKEAAEAAEKAVEKTAKTISFSESEANTLSRNTPAKKASIHTVSTPTTDRYNLRLRHISAKVVSGGAPHSLPAAVESAVKSLETAKKATSSTPPSTLQVPPPKPNDMIHPQQHKTPITHNSPHAYQTQTGYSTVYGGGNNQLLPASLQPARTVPQRPVTAHHTTPQVHASSLPKNIKAIQPMVARSGEDRHWALLLKLIADFAEDRKYLISPMNLTTHNNNPNGIHVFVDASNIFIGFHDQLKRSRGIPVETRIPPVNLSFDALALLMERRRPVAKRVLVGSTPHLPAFDKAKAVGYECSILEKVYKARELTERQIFFKEQEQERALHNDRKRAKAPPANNVATLNGGGTGSGSGSGSETTAPQYAPARMIEQGVDEILHLKILESVVDSDVPSTIVLATGDAAQAEYSEGFMAMAERALKKGWTVELVSWSKNISLMYTRREWKQAWGERFRVVELDDYAEELLDM